MTSSASDIEERGFWVEGHGKTRRVRMTKLYNVWSSMRSRCLNQNHHAYQMYGGRGIGICKEWGQFSAFRIWALSAGYCAGLYLDRMNNDLGYSPDNCRWIGAAESVRNRRVTKLDPLAANEIRLSNDTHRSIAARFGVSREHVRDIKKGKCWRAA